MHYYKNIFCLFSPILFIWKIHSFADNSSGHFMRMTEYYEIIKLDPDDVWKLDILNIDNTIVK